MAFRRGWKGRKPQISLPQQLGWGAGICWKEAEEKKGGSDASFSASHMKMCLLAPLWQQWLCFPFFDTSCSPAWLPVWEGGVLLPGSWQ